MNSKLRYYLKGLNKFEKAIIESVTIGQTKEKYSTEYFKHILINSGKKSVTNENDENKIKIDFIAYYSREECSKAFIDSTILYISILDTIAFNYNQLLPEKILNSIIELKDFNIKFLSSTFIGELNTEELGRLLFETTKKIIHIIYQLKRLIQ